MPKPKIKRKTTAELILNGIGAPIASIEFDSTEMSKEQLLEEASRQFLEMFSFKFYEGRVKK